MTITCDIGGKQLEARDRSGNVVFKGAETTSRRRPSWRTGTMRSWTGEDAEKI